VRDESSGLVAKRMEGAASALLEALDSWAFFLGITVNQGVLGQDQAAFGGTIGLIPFAFGTRRHTIHVSRLVCGVVSGVSIP
jgi:hypothetical protein